MSEYLGVWCPTCEQDCLPLPNGRCGFCDTRVSNPDEPPDSIAADLVDQLPARQEERVVICKIDGCTNPSAGKRGPWARMCQAHISEEVARRQAKRHGNGQTKGTLTAPAAPEPASRQAPRPAAKGTRKSGARNGEGPPGSLTELAYRVDMAVVALASARDAHKEAVTALLAALEEQAA